MATSKPIVGKMLATLKFGGDIYDYFHCNIQHLLNNDNSLDFISYELALKMGDMTSKLKSLQLKSRKIVMNGSLC